MAGKVKRRHRSSVILKTYRSSIFIGVRRQPAYCYAVILVYLSLITSFTFKTIHSTSIFPSPLSFVCRSKVSNMGLLPSIFLLILQRCQKDPLHIKACFCFILSYDPSEEHIQVIVKNRPDSAQSAVHSKNRKDW